MGRPAFDDRVAGYAISPTHRDGPTLQPTVEFTTAHENNRVLDVSTGTGFTAHALLRTGAEVVATDISHGMLRHTLASPSSVLTGALSDTHSLAFANNIFDAVSCRHAFHHYIDGPTAMHEMARVVRPGGRVVVADTIAPEDDAAARAMHEIEKIRDPTHVVNRPVADLLELFESAGLDPVQTKLAETELLFDPWCDRTDVDQKTRDGLWDKFTQDTATKIIFSVHESDQHRTFSWPNAIIAGVRAL
jgi:SAM-dependent methyltransferase